MYAINAKLFCDWRNVSSFLGFGLGNFEASETWRNFRNFRNLAKPYFFFFIETEPGRTDEAKQPEPKW